MSSIAEQFDRVLEHLLPSCVEVYGNRLIALAVFGSVARRTAGPDSDVDFLIVADGLPKRRIPRVHEFQAVERSLGPLLADIRAAGVNVTLFPVFKTPAEVQQGSPLFLDMVEDARILFDREDFLRNALQAQKDRLERLGARRIWRGNAWYWDLKPDYVPGEVFDL